MKLNATHYKAMQEARKSLAKAEKKQKMQ